MFQGSAPVVRRRTTCARKALVGVGLAIRMTLTEFPAAFATNANRLDGSSATLCGSSPTRIVRRTVFDEVRMTVTVSAPGLTTHTNRPSRDIEIGLEVVAPENVRRACAALATGPAAAGVAAGRAAGREPPVAARAEKAKPPRITATGATSRRALRWYALMQTSFGHSAPTSPPPRTTLPGAAPGSQVPPETYLRRAAGEGARRSRRSGSRGAGAAGGREPREVIRGRRGGVAGRPGGRPPAVRDRRPHLGAAAGRGDDLEAPAERLHALGAGGEAEMAVGQRGGAGVGVAPPAVVAAAKLDAVARARDGQRDTLCGRMPRGVRQELAAEREQQLVVGAGRVRRDRDHGRLGVAAGLPRGDRPPRRPEPGGLEQRGVKLEDLVAQALDRPAERGLRPVDVLGPAAPRLLEVLLRAQQLLHELVVERVGELAPGARLGGERLRHKRAAALRELADALRAPGQKDRHDDRQAGARGDVERVDGKQPQADLVAEVGVRDGRGDEAGDRERGDAERQPRAAEDRDEDRHEQTVPQGALGAALGGP